MVLTSETKKSIFFALVIVILIVLLFVVGFHGSNTLSSSRADLQTLDNQIAENQSQTNLLMQDKFKYDTQLHELQTQLETEKATLARNQLLLQNLTDSASAEKSTLQQQFEAEDAKAKTELTNFSTVQADYDEKTAQMNTEIASQQAKVAESVATINSLNTQITALTNARDQCNSNLTVLNNNLQQLINEKRIKLSILQKCMYKAENRSCQRDYPDNYFKTKDGKAVICPTGYKLADYGTREICLFPFDLNTPEDQKIDARGSSIPCFGVWPNDNWDYPNSTTTDIKVDGKFIWAPQGYVTDPMPADLVCNSQL